MTRYANIRYVNKEILRKLNYLSAHHKYNRQLTMESIDALPDDAVIAIEMVIIHEHAQGKPVEPHARCRVIVKDNIDYFGWAFLDVNFDSFALLPTKKDIEEIAPPKTKPKRKAKKKA